MTTGLRVDHRWGVLLGLQVGKVEFPSFCLFPGRENTKKTNLGKPYPDDCKGQETMKGMEGQKQAQSQVICMPIQDIFRKITLKVSCGSIQHAILGILTLDTSSYSEPPLSSQKTVAPGNT